LWVAALGVALASIAGPTPSLASTFQDRVETLARIQALNADLLGHDSATETLTRWCADHHLAAPPNIVAERVTGQDKPADAEVRALLHADPGEPIAYRRVRLVCGPRVLSVADNWYRPGRLTEAMNHQLETTDAPFGAVVRPLGFHRHTLDATILFDPKRGGPTPYVVLRHRAVLTAAATPFALVVETYTREAVAGP
jgi:hypothetical protein